MWSVLSVDIDFILSKEKEKKRKLPYFLLNRTKIITGLRRPPGIKIFPL